MRLPALFLSACLLPVTAHADDIKTFVVSATGVDPTISTSGTFTVDVTTGSLVSVDLTVPAPLALTYVSTEDYLDLTPYGVTGIIEYFSSTTGNSYRSIDLYFPVANLIGFQGGSICSVATPCPGLANYEPTGIQGGVSYFGLASQITRPIAYGTAQTPEPSAFALLGTGALGVVGAFRRRDQR